MKPEEYVKNVCVSRFIWYFYINLYTTLLLGQEIHSLDRMIITISHLSFPAKSKEISFTSNFKISIINVCIYFSWYAS
jgi:hypothetical protein